MHRGDPNRISQAFSLEPDGIATFFPACDREQWRGLQGQSLPPSGCVQLCTGSVAKFRRAKYNPPHAPPTDDPLSPGYAEPARSPFGRRGRAAAEAAPERTEPRVEIVESPGLRWINIERPARSSRRGWRSASSSTPSTTRTSARATSAEGRRVRRLPVHRPALPALRQSRLASQRRRAGHLRRPRLPDPRSEPAAAADQTCSSSPATRTGETPSSPRARATCSTGSSMTAWTLVPMLNKIGNKLERIEEETSSARATTSCATSSMSKRRSSTSARSSVRSGRHPRPRAQQGPLHR